MAQIIAQLGSSVLPSGNWPQALALSLALLPIGGMAQPFSVQPMRDGSGDVRLEFAARTGSYYIVQRRAALTAPSVPMALLWPAGATGSYQDQPAADAVFFQIVEAPVGAPLDTDHDGMDDDYEWRRQPRLDPLDPGDATELADGGPLTHQQQYRAELFREGQRRLAAGGDHLMALRTDGSLWAWGGNRFGQLGDGTTNSQPSPIPVAPGSRWRAVAAGGARSFAIAGDGSLWGWGFGRDGSLGDGGQTNRFVPVRLGEATGWSKIRASQFHVLALKDDGSLWGWGVNSSGQLGDGSTEARNVPTRIGTATNWMDVSVGQNFSLGLTTDGKLFGWGYNEWGQLGQATLEVSQPSPLPIAANSSWRAVSAGDFHGLALRSDGTLWTWGQVFEATADGFVTSTNRFDPVPVNASAHWLGLAAGYQHSVAVDLEGRLWAWGLNAFGELAIGHELPRPEPVRISPDDRWLTVVTAALHHVAIRADGTLWHWSGSSGLSSEIASPFKAVLPGQRFTTMSAGDHHALAIDDQRRVWTWGRNDLGQLGDGTTEPGLPRLTVSNLFGVAVSAAGNRSLVIDESGALWVWGATQSSQSWPMPFPTSLGTPRDPGSRWSVVVSGGWHTVALDGLRRLHVWGENSHGQIPPTGLEPLEFSSVGAGAWSTYGVTRAGELHIWGRFQIPSGTIYDGKLPDEGRPFTRVAAGARHALALRDDGTLWSMGDNTFGQLGTGTNVYASMIKPVMTNVTWKAMAAYYHCVAIRSDGTLWAWGNSANRRVPVMISSATTWKAVAAGYNFSLALQEDGSLWSWGDRSFGQLGATPMAQSSNDPEWKPPSPP